jgi:hypothetical protein
MAVALRKPPPSPAEILELIEAKKAHVPVLMQRQADAAELSISGHAMTGISYVCPFRSPAEIVEIVVSLSPDEIADAERHRREGHGVGSPDGPLAKRYAWDRAIKSAPVGFEPIYAQARRITAVH